MQKTAHSVDVMERAESPLRPVMVRNLAIAAPAFNEAAGISLAIHSWLAYLRNYRKLHAFEIVICDDGSRDNTHQILTGIAKDNPEVIVVQHSRNQGGGAAIATAIAATTMAWVLIIDSDGQFPIENLDRMIQAIEASGAQAVSGARQKKKDTLFLRFGSWSSGLVSNWCHGARYADFNSACKLVRGDLLRSMRLECLGLNYSTEMMSKLIERGVEIPEVEIQHLPRVAGVSSGRAIRSARDRLLFVAYLALRQLLLRLKVIRVI